MALALNNQWGWYAIKQRNQTKTDDQFLKNLVLNLLLIRYRHFLFCEIHPISNIKKKTCVAHIGEWFNLHFLVQDICETSSYKSYS